MGKRPRGGAPLPLAQRRSTRTSDHYLILNDGTAQAAHLHVFDAEYVTGEELISEQNIETEGTIAVPLPAESGLWVRFAKS